MEQESIEFAGERIPLIHFTELRQRLFIALLTTLFFSTAIGLFLGIRIVEMAIQPAINSGVTIGTGSPTEFLGVIIRISLTLGFTLALPVWLFHLLRWLAPGLYPHEKKLSCLVTLVAPSLFFLSIPVALVFILPLAIRIFGDISSPTVSPSWQLSSYIGFISRIVTGTTAIFEIPLITLILGWAGVAKKSLRKRVVVAVVIGCCIPFVDFLLQVIEAFWLVPLAGLVGFLLLGPTGVVEFIRNFRRFASRARNNYGTMFDGVTEINENAKRTD